MGLWLDASLLSQGLWGDRKDSLGAFCLSMILTWRKFCILCGAGVAGLGELWARQPLGPALSLSLTPG